MKRPDARNLINALLNLDVIPVEDGNPGETYWCAYPTHSGAPPLLLILESERTQRLDLVEAEVLRYRRLYDVPNIQHFQPVSRKVIYTLRMRLQAEYCFTLGRNLVVYEEDDPVWVKLAFAGLDVLWYEPVRDARKKPPWPAADPVSLGPTPPSVPQPMPDPTSGSPSRLPPTSIPPISPSSPDPDRVPVRAPRLVTYRAKRKLKQELKKKWASGEPSSDSDRTSSAASSAESSETKPKRKPGRPSKKSSPANGK